MDRLQRRPANWRSSICANHLALGSTTSCLRDPSRELVRTVRRQECSESHIQSPGPARQAASCITTAHMSPGLLAVGVPVGLILAVGVTEGTVVSVVSNCAGDGSGVGAASLRAAAPNASALPTVAINSTPANIQAHRGFSHAPRGGSPTLVIGCAAMSRGDSAPSRTTNDSASSAGLAKRSSRSFAIACATI